jgi:hypothetical protein
MESLQKENRDVMCKLSNELDANCNITLDNTLAYEDGSLPRAWKFKNKNFNTATLPCGHTFHPSAISLSFLVNDMRCPVCRQGVEDRMNVACIPSKMRNEFGIRMGEILKQQQMENLQEDLNLMIDSMIQDVVHSYPHFYKDIWIHVRVRDAGGGEDDGNKEYTFYKTPIFRISAPAINPFQKSFHRALQRITKKENAMAKISIYWETPHNIVEVACSRFFQCAALINELKSSALSVTTLSTNQLAVKVENHDTNFVVSIFPVGIVISVALKIYTMLCEEDMESLSDVSDTID